MSWTGAEKATKVKEFYAKMLVEGVAAPAQAAPAQAAPVVK